MERWRVPLASARSAGLWLGRLGDGSAYMATVSGTDRYGAARRDGLSVTSVIACRRYLCVGCGSVLTVVPGCRAAAALRTSGWRQLQTPNSDNYISPSDPLVA